MTISACVVLSVGLVVLVGVGNVFHPARSQEFFSCGSPHVSRKEWLCSECCSLCISSFSLSSPHVRLKEWLCSECCSLCVLLFICCGPPVSRRKEWLYTSVCDWWSVGAILSVWVVRMSADGRSGCTHQCVTGGVWERYFQSELSACQQTEGVVVHVSVWLVEWGSDAFSLSCPHVSRWRKWLCSEGWQCSLCMFCFSGVHVSVWLVECGSDTVRDVSGPPSVLRQHAGRDSVQGMCVVVVFAGSPILPVIIKVYQCHLRMFFPRY